MTTGTPPSSCGHLRPEPVEAAAQAFLICPGEAVVPFEARFLYDCGDPYAVQIRFAESADEEPFNGWTFARSLLEEGLRVPAGEGDVQILPCSEGWTGLELHSRQRIALILLPTGALRGFLAASYLKVPAGDEHRLLRIDPGLAELLNETH
ncbi:SsgA family sporulation/cell division regulator [Streptomyces sp. NPDC003832]